MKKFEKQKGFSLVEVLVAMFIFVTIMLAISGIFVKITASYKKARALQIDTENAQFAANYMAKILRTSHVSWMWDWEGFCPGLGPGASTYNPGADAIRVYDFSQQKCFRFLFTGNDPDANVANRLTIAEIPASERMDCIESAWPSPVNVVQVAKNITGNFKVSGYSCDNTDTVEPYLVLNGAGKVTISMKVCPEGGCGGNPRDEVNMQTTVSLRSLYETFN